MTEETCRECGAPVPAGATCRENLHSLLFIEAEIPGGPGEVAHFYAVASYGLQHPESMGYTAETVEGLRAAVLDVLEGRATIADIRARMRHLVGQAGRVTRRGDEPVPRSGVADWPVNASWVVAGGVDSYRERVETWARSVVEALEADR